MDISGAMQMRYAKIEECECVNGNGWGVSLYIQGCPFHCPGCFNPETWDFNGGEKWTFDTEKIVLELLKQDWVNRCSILGGEPLYIDNLVDLLYFTDKIKKLLKLDIWLWTGYTWEQIQERIKQAQVVWPDTLDDMYLEALIKNIDFLITGPFIEEEKDLTLQWRGSRNQEVIDVQATLYQGKKILYV